MVMTDIEITNELAGDEILTVYNAEKARREKLSARAIEREARKREERARIAAVNAELDAALDGLVGEDGACTIPPGETRTFQLGGLPVTASCSGSGCLNREIEWEICVFVLGMITGFIAMGILAWVFG
jgi:hypothetical protein